MNVPHTRSDSLEQHQTDIWLATNSCIPSQELSYTYVQRKKDYSSHQKVLVKRGGYEYVKYIPCKTAAK